MTMPPTTANALTPQDIARLVGEVISRIHRETAKAGQPAVAAVPAPAAVATVTLTDRVVSAELLEQKEQQRIQIQVLETRLKEEMMSRAELSANLNLLREQHDSLKQQKDRQDADM